MAASSSSSIHLLLLLLKNLHLFSPSLLSIFSMVSSSSSSIHLRLSSPRRTFIFSVSLSKSSVHTRYNFPQPLPETVALVEDIVVEYVTDLTHKAQEIGSKRGRLLVDDFLYLIRKVIHRMKMGNICLDLNLQQEVVRNLKLLVQHQRASCLPNF